MNKKLDLKGQRFGRLTVMQDSLKRIRKYVIWICLCDCGNLIEARSSHLKYGSIKSCGCLMRERSSKANRGKKHAYKHGLSGTRLYFTWKSILARCNNPADSNYKKYGAKGISVCKRWEKDIFAFMNWALSSGYKDNLTIDRIDNDGNYEPKNCQWITLSENSKKAHIQRRLKSLNQLGPC